MTKHNFNLNLQNGNTCLFLMHEQYLPTNLVLCADIRGSKKAITIKMLEQISNLPMALQNMLSLMMILKIKMIQADSMWQVGSQKYEQMCTSDKTFAWIFPITLTIGLADFAESRLLYALVVPQEQDHLYLHRALLQSSYFHKLTDFVFCALQWQWTVLHGYDITALSGRHSTVHTTWYQYKGCPFKNKRNGAYIYERGIVQYVHDTIS